MAAAGRRIRLHRLSQPDELIAWVEFYDQVRGTGSGQRPQPARASGPISGPISRPQAAPTSGPITQPTAVNETFTPDMSSASGPLDPWGGGRQGEPGAASQPHATPTPRFTAPSLPDLESALRAWGDEGDNGVRFVDPDNPSESSVREFGESDDDAWLRETNALNRIEQTPRDGAFDAGNMENVASGPAEPAQPTAPYTPTHGPASASAPEEQLPWRYQQSGRPQTNATRRDTWREQPAGRPSETPMPAPSMPTPRDPEPDAGWDDQFDEHDTGDERDWETEEEPAASDLEAAPWRDANWQRPQLPRFGPDHDESSSQ